MVSTSAATSVAGTVAAICRALGGRTLRSTVVPVDSQQRQTGDLLGEGLELGNHGLVVQAQFPARQFFAVKLDRTLGEEIACINEDGNAIHGAPT